MTIHHGIDDATIRRPVATIGSFDGVHRGHLGVLEALKGAARRVDGESVVITFDPHPREVLYPLERKPGLLTTLPEKAMILERAWVDHLVVLEFTAGLGALEYADFVRRVLVEALGIRGLVVGHDHRLGRGRAGNLESLQRLAGEYRFFLYRCPVIETGDAGVSSTRISDALARGNVRLANALLGYRYSLAGEVVTGNQLGRRIGFPTANLRVEDDRKCLPAPGVYVVDAVVDGDSTGGLLNVGTRPTVSTSGALSVEVHLLDFHRDIYGQRLSVSLVDRLREERKFEHVEELRQQLEQDKAAAALPGAGRGDIFSR